MTKKFRISMLIGLILTLISVSVAFGFSIGNADGVWGTADTNGAQCDGWASGAGDTPTYGSGSAKRDYWDQTTGYTNTDENQIRYGRDAYYYDGRWYGRTCANTEFAEQSGFGFDGKNGIITPNVGVPFFLGKFTHYNNPIFATDDNGYNNNPLAYVDMTTTVPVICNDGTTSTNFVFTTRFTLDETSNTAGTCAYGEVGDEPCPDKVTVTEPESAIFTCPDGPYTVNTLGFTSSGLNGQTCDLSFNPESVATEFVTQERQDNTACLWAEISAPTADIEPIKECVTPGSQVPYYTINTISNGPGSGVEVQLVDSLPAGVGFQSYTSQLTTSSGTEDQGSCTYDDTTRQVTCNLLTSLPSITVDPNARWTVNIYVTFGVGSFNNSVTASMASRIDPNLDNNTSEATCSTTAVDLVSFDAISETDAVRLTWETVNEMNTMGFNLYRADTVEGDRVQINETLIPSSFIDNPFGSLYAYLDKDVESGKTYFYWLEEQEFSMLEKTIFGPVEIIYFSPVSVNYNMQAW